MLETNGVEFFKRMEEEFKRKFEITMSMDVMFHSVSIGGDFVLHPDQYIEAPKYIQIPIIEWKFVCLKCLTIHEKINPAVDPYFTIVDPGKPFHAMCPRH